MFVLTVYFLLNVHSNSYPFYVKMKPNDFQTTTNVHSEHITATLMQLVQTRKGLSLVHAGAGSLGTESRVLVCFSRLARAIQYSEVDETICKNVSFCCFSNTNNGY